MNELYEKPLHTEGNFWAGHDRNSILRVIEAGLHYLTTTDLVNLHATISAVQIKSCLLYTSPSPRDTNPSRMPSSA